jgi:xanthine dioxygenase
MRPFPLPYFCKLVPSNLSSSLQTWKNPVTGSLHFQVHPCAAQELLIDPLPEGASRDGALYPDGAHLTDLKEVRGLLYKMQRPAIAPNVRSSCSFPPVSLCTSHTDDVMDPAAQLVYPHDWKEKDLILFHNRGVMHSAVGALRPDQVRAFHQCNLAASNDPVGPTPEDVKRYA